MPASTGQSGANVVQTPVNSNLLLVYLLFTSSIADPSAILSKLSTCAEILACYTPSSVRMSWSPYPAESSESAPAWPNQVVHSYNYGPSGALKPVVYAIILTIIAGIIDSIAI